MKQRQKSEPILHFSAMKGDQQGFSMVEILVTLLVVSVGLLGMAALQTRSLSSTHTAALGSQATLLANDICDRMRANRQQAQAGKYDIGLDDAAAAKGAVGVTLLDLQQWKAALARLPGPGKGSIEVKGSSSTATIIIEWDDSKGAEPPVQVQVQTRL